MSNGRRWLTQIVSLILLDTQALVWLATGASRLGNAARDIVDRALAADELLVSAISFWEVAMLLRKGRLRMQEDVAAFRVRILALGVREAPVTSAIGISAVRLENLPEDPADRMIVATALDRGAALLTADQRILRWNSELRRIDARL